MSTDSLSPTKSPNTSTPCRRFYRTANEGASGEFGIMEKFVISENESGRKIMERLRQFGDKHGMPISQENGQRCYGPPKDWMGPPPPKGSEVFVGKLPRELYEPDIVPIFEKMGKIYEIRLMMDFSGTNRGYCFIQYTKPEDAQRAILELNNYEIAKDKKIGVLKSVDNCRLFVGGIPKDKSELDIFHEISSVTEGVRKVIAYPSAQDRTKNRGFAFVEYDSHKTAAMARRKMIPGKVKLWGQDLAVDWAEPEPEVDSEIMNKVQNLYVRNLMLCTTEDTLRLLFNDVSSNGVERVKKINDYAFIHFVSREQADAARIALNGTDIDGATIEINWAKPLDKANSTKSRSGRHVSNGNRSNSSSVSPLPLGNHGHNMRDQQCFNQPTLIYQVGTTYLGHFSSGPISSVFPLGTIPLTVTPRTNGLRVKLFFHDKLGKKSKLRSFVTCKMSKMLQFGQPCGNFSNQDLSHNPLTYYNLTPVYQDFSSASTSPSYASTNPVQYLARLCITMGWPEPTYEAFQYAESSPPLYYFVVNINQGGVLQQIEGKPSVSPYTAKASVAADIIHMLCGPIAPAPMHYMQLTPTPFAN